MITRYLIFIVAMICALPVFAQKDRPVVQFSGIVQNAKDASPLPFTTIRIKNTNRGTISNFDGFFSMVVHVEDTIEFTSIGFRKSAVIIPSDISNSRYTIIQSMQPDTILLEESVVFPWPTPEQFREAFLNLDIPDDDLERARKNLSQDVLMAINQGMAMSGSENQKLYMQNMAKGYYYAGGQPLYTEMGGMRIPNSFLDPFAWARFFNALKKGDFKRQEE